MLQRLRTFLRWYRFYLRNTGETACPGTFIAEVTYHCPLGCAMCSLHAGKTGGAPPRKETEELDAEAWSSVFAQYAHMGGRNVLITGGEPTVRRDLPELVKAAARGGLRPHLLTSGYYLDEELAEHLCREGVASWHLSLDGPDCVHNAIRGREDAFERMTRALECLRQATARRGGRAQIVLQCTVTARNQGHLADTLRVATELAADTLIFSHHSFVEPDVFCAEAQTARGENWKLAPELRDVDPEILRREVREVDSMRSQLPRVEWSPRLAPDEIARWYQDPEFAVVSRCFYPWQGVSVGAYGDVFVCPMSPCAGNVQQDSLAALVNGPGLRRFRQTVARAGILTGCQKCCNLRNRLWRWIPSRPRRGRRSKAPGGVNE